MSLSFALALPTPDTQSLILAWQPESSCSRLHDITSQQDKNSYSQSTALSFLRIQMSNPEAHAAWTLSPLSPRGLPLFSGLPYSCLPGLGCPSSIQALRSSGRLQWPSLCPAPGSKRKTSFSPGVFWLLPAPGVSLDDAVLSVTLVTLPVQCPFSMGISRNSTRLNDLFILSLLHFRVMRLGRYIFFSHCPGASIFNGVWHMVGTEVVCMSEQFNHGKDQLNSEHDEGNYNSWC